MLYNQPEIGALSRPLSISDKRKLRAALSRLVEPGGSSGFGSGLDAAKALNGASIQQNPGLAMGPMQSPNPSSLAGALAVGLGSGFGPGPLSLAQTIGGAVLNPSGFMSTNTQTIPGIGTLAFSPGPLGAFTGLTGFGGIINAAGALNAANLNNIMANDPHATTASGPGWGGAFSNGTWSGTLPGGLSMATQRAMIKEIAKQHYANQHATNPTGPGGLGSGGWGSPGATEPRDPHGGNGGSKGPAGSHGEQGSKPRKDW